MADACRRLVAKAQRLGSDPAFSSDQDSEKDRERCLLPGDGAGCGRSDPGPGAEMADVAGPRQPLTQLRVLGDQGCPGAQVVRHRRQSGVEADVIEPKASSLLPAAPRKSRVRSFYYLALDK